MEPAGDWTSVSLHTLVAVIARSPIVVAPVSRPLLPAGYDEIDAAVLNWLAAEARRLRARLVMM